MFEVIHYSSEAIQGVQFNVKLQIGIGIYAHAKIWLKELFHGGGVSLLAFTSEETVDSPFAFERKD